MISIIIPALNEEKYLPILLNAIKKQTYKDYEVIIADGGSEDKTKKIARKYGCKIVPGGSPAKGRNHGAEHAKGEYLLFLDADVVFDNFFVEKMLDEFIKKNLDAGTSSIGYEPNNIIDRMTTPVFNIYIRLFEKTKSPRAPGFCIIIKKSTFNKIKGFSEKLKVAEDHDLVAKAAHIGKFGVLSPKIKVSLRRWKKEGTIKLFLKYMSVELHLLFHKTIPKDMIEYEYGEYD